MPAWLPRLLADEIGFGGEAHLLVTAGDRIRWLGAGDPAGGGPGWVLRIGELQAGDWSLARPLAGPAGEWPPLPDRQGLPGDDWQLLLPAEFIQQRGPTRGSVSGRSRGDGWVLRDRLHCLVGPEVGGGVVPPGCGDGRAAGGPAAAAMLTVSSVSLPGIPLPMTLRVRSGHDPKVAAGWGWSMHCSLDDDGALVAVVRSIHTTPATVEVYIETAPAWRGRGIGRWLLARALAVAMAAGRRLVYVVAASNRSSVAVARAVGLTEHAVWELVGKGPSDVAHKGR